LSTLEVARIGRPHGLRGALKVDLYWQGSSSLFEVQALQVALPDGSVQQLRVEELRRAGKFLHVKFAGVEDRDAAARLTGARILVDREALPALEPGEAYLVDLVGAQVVAPDGVVGEVVRVEIYPSLETLRIRRPDGSEVEQALLPQFVSSIDVAARRVELLSRDGLLE